MQSNSNYGKEQKYIKKLDSDIAHEQARLRSLRAQIDQSHALVENLKESKLEDARYLDQSYEDIKEINRLNIIINDYIDYYRSVSERIDRLLARKEKIELRTRTRQAGEEAIQAQRELMELASSMQVLKSRRRPDQ